MLGSPILAPAAAPPPCFLMAAARTFVYLVTVYTQPSNDAMQQHCNKRPQAGLLHLTYDAACQIDVLPASPRAVS